MRYFFSLPCSILKKVVVAIIGFVVLFIGILLIFLPGPAVVVIPLGLSILAIEFEWPKKILKRTKEKGEKVLSRIKKRK